MQRCVTSKLSHLTSATTIVVCNKLVLDLRVYWDLIFIS